MAVEFAKNREAFDRLCRALRSPTEPPFEQAGAETYEASSKACDMLAALGLYRVNSAAQLNQSLKSGRIDAIAQESLWDGDPTKMLAFAILPVWFWENYELGPFDNFWPFRVLSVPFPVDDTEDAAGKTEAANPWCGRRLQCGHLLGAVTVPGPGFLSVALGFNS